MHDDIGVGEQVHVRGIDAASCFDGIVTAIDVRNLKSVLLVVRSQEDDQDYQVDATDVCVRGKCNQRTGSDVERAIEAVARYDELQKHN